jgi:hypothetical protein
MRLPLPGLTEGSINRSKGKWDVRGEIAGENLLDLGNSEVGYG